jgi:hypothetical protein
MARLANRLHERFCWLVAEGLDRKAAYAKLCPHANATAEAGYKLFKRTDIKSRIAEIQTEVQSRAVCDIDAKRDMLRQMIEGTIPTKVIRRADGKVEAVFDRLAALTVDSKLAGEFAEDKRLDTSGDIKLTFEVYHRNHPAPPREWMEAQIIAPEPATLDFSRYENAPISGPDLDDLQSKPFKEL